MRRLFSLFASFAVALVSGATAGADGDNRLRWLPDPKLTPGAFVESSAAAICVRGYDRAHRVWHDKTGTLAKHHIAPSEAARFEDDDLIPVCLGGDNASHLNHWPQPNDGQWGAAAKDVLERRICNEICLTRDDAQLARYQAAFAKDWVALYRATMGK